MRKTGRRSQRWLLAKTKGSEKDAACSFNCTLCLSNRLCQARVHLVRQLSMKEDMKIKRMFADLCIICCRRIENLNHINSSKTSCAVYQVGQLETLPAISSTLCVIYMLKTNHMLIKRESNAVINTICQKSLSTLDILTSM